MDQFIGRYYVVKDLQYRGPLAVSRYPTLEQAMAAYKALPADKMKALGIESCHQPPRTLDFVHCIGGKNYLVPDYRKSLAWYREDILENVHQMMETLNVIDAREIFFTTADHKTLFTVRDGENIVLDLHDGNRKLLPCRFVDEQHFRFGNSDAFHTREFAELCQQDGHTYRPEHPLPGAYFGTYDLYHIADTRGCPYSFMGYKYAEGKIRPGHYKRVYTGMLAKETTLDEIFALHNRDDRPLNQEIHSLSVSDIIITHKGREHKAMYVDSIGFRELPGMVQKLMRMGKPRADHQKSER